MPDQSETVATWKQECALPLLRQLIVADVYSVLLAIGANLAVHYGLTSDGLEPMVRWIRNCAIVGAIATLIAALLYLRIDDDDPRSRDLQPRSTNPLELVGRDR